MLVFNIEIPKRAFRFYEKGDIDKTVEALEKSLSKSPLNPGAKYLYSLLHVDTAFANHNVDTAFYYIKAAIVDFDSVSDAKDIEDLLDLGIDSTSLQVHKDVIDSLSFTLVRNKHTIGDYNWFVKTHDDAIQIEEAIRLRNHIAFEDAAKINTYQSYLGFMEAYPNTEDYQEAESRYKKLLFEARTADNTLKSHADFLEEYPGTPYREISEKRIFEISTTLNSIPAYTDFLKKYPSSKFKEKIIPRLYHIVKEKYGSEAFPKFFQFQSNLDSIDQVISLEQPLWMPKLSDDKYAFMLLDGTEILNTNFSFVPESYFCNMIAQDFVVGGSTELDRIVARNGEVIYNRPFKSVEDAGFGYIKVQGDDGHILLHKSGEVIISEPAEDFATFNEHFIKVKKNGLWGLTTINGFDILDPEYASIDTLGDHLLIEKDGRLAFTKSENLFPAVEGEQATFKFQYDELEVLDNGYYLVFDGDKEAILDNQLNTVLPFSTVEIYDKSYGWLLKEESKVRMIHQNHKDFQDSVYEELVENDNWIGLRTGEKWTLLSQDNKIAPSYDYDSLQFWGENMVILQKSDSLFARFKNGKELLLTEGWEPKLLVPQVYAKTGEQASSDFFMLSNPKKFRKVYNSWGKEILAATYQDVTALGPDLIKLQKKNAALIDSTGAFVLNFIYDGIASYDNGYVSILKDEKVGIINLEKAINIPPTYKARLRAYNDSILIANEDGLKGFINIKNEVLSGFDYDEILFWTDSIALTRIEDEWVLHRIEDESFVFEGILEYEFLKDDSEERIIQVTTATGKGIISNSRGLIIEPTYNEIIPLGTEESPVYFVQKFVKEASLYIVIYMDKNGNKLFTQTFQEDQYFKIACSH